MKVAKIAIFYLAIFIEMADEWGQVLLKVTHRVPTERIGERYGAFLLIIMSVFFLLPCHRAKLASKNAEHQWGRNHHDHPSLQQSHRRSL